MADRDMAPVSGITLSPVSDDLAAAGFVAAVGERVGVVGVLTGLDRRARRLHSGVECDSHLGCDRYYAWDGEDAATSAWWPQGLTTSAEAGPTATARLGRTVVLAAWYARSRWRGDVAVRVTVLDLADTQQPRYAHVLLVEPQRRTWSRRWRHRDLPVHAGGLVWVDDLLLVADTRLGFRVFDLRDVVRVPDGHRRTRGCAYLLPQRACWRARATDASRPLRWSFGSLDRTDLENRWLIAGEYSKGGTGARLVRLPLAPLLAGKPAAAVEVMTTDLPSMQGATRVDGAYWISASSGRRHRGHLWTVRPGGTPKKFDHVLPIGPEDVSYDAECRCLWTQTEYPGRRFLLCVPLPAAT